MEAGTDQWSGFGYGRQDPNGYMARVSTFGSCVDLNSRLIATFPVYALAGGRPVELPTWYRTSPEPELYSDWVIFMKAAVNSFLIAGETILWATGRYQRTGLPARFMVLDPQLVTVDDNGDYFLDDGDRLNRADICHIKYQQAPGIQRRGFGPLQWSARHLVSTKTLDEYAMSIAKYGVWAVLKSPRALTSKQAGDLQEQWMMSRTGRPGSPAILSGGLDYEPLSISPKDMALLDLKYFDQRAICAAFGVPAPMLSVPTENGLTYQTTVMLADWHWRATLRTHSDSMAAAMSQWLLPRGTELEFNPDRYVQPPIEQRIPMYAAGIAAGILTVDEARAAERLPTLGATAEPDIDALIGAPQ
jgi:HK97 family phage portal protein